MKGFLEHCQLFFIEAAVQVKQRFPRSDPIFSSLTFLDPSAVSSNHCSTILDVASKFPNIIAPDDLQKLDSEWREFSFTDLPPYDPREIHIDCYWGDVAALTDGCGEMKFPTLGYFVKSVLSLPHSNADVEKIFPKLLLSKLSNETDLKHPQWILF